MLRGGVFWHREARNLGISTNPSSTETHRQMNWLVGFLFLERGFLAKDIAEDILGEGQDKR